MIIKCCSLFFVFSIFSLQLFSMEKNSNNKVLHLSELQEKAEQERKLAQDTWKKLPQSWRAGAKQAATNLGQTETKYKKLQEINEFQRAKQMKNPLGYLQYLDQLEKENKAQYTQTQKLATKLKIGDNEFKDGLHHNYQLIQKEIEDEKKLVQRALSQNSQNPPQQPVPPSSKSMKMPLVGAAALATRIAETDLLKHQPQITLDSFLSGLAEVSSNFVISSAIGVPASMALGACSQAEAVREQLEKMDTTINSNPFTDAWCGMNLGCSYQESIEGLKIVLCAAEKLDAGKRRIIESTEGHLQAFVAYVYEGYQSLKQEYPTLFKTKKKKNDEKSLDGLSHDDGCLKEYIQKRYGEEITIQKFVRERSKEYAAAKKREAEKSNDKKKEQQKKLTAHEKEDSVEQQQYDLFPCSQVYDLQDEQKKHTDTLHTQERDKAFNEQQQKLRNLFEKYKLAKDEKEYQNAFSNVVGGVNGIAAIAGIFGNRQEANKIRTFGFSALQAFDCMRTIANKGLMNAGIHPVVGILTAIESLCGLFDDGDAMNDGFQAILDAITQGVMHLSQQLHEMHKEMREQFDEMRKRDVMHHLIILEKFSVLHQDATCIIENIKDLRSYMQAQHHALQDELNALHARIDLQTDRIFKNLIESRIEGINQLIERGLLLTERDDISPEEFNKYLEKLFIKATNLASANSLTGGSVGTDSMAIQTTLQEPIILKNIFEHPGFANINFLSEYLAEHYNEFDHEKLVNPLIWMKCVIAMIDMLNEKLFNKEKQTKDKEPYPADESMKERDIQKLLMLKKHGQKVLAFIEKLAQDNYIQKLAIEQQQHLQQLLNSLEREQEKYEEKITEVVKREHRAEIEKEKSKEKRILKSYECKECVKHIINAINHAQEFRDLIARYAPCHSTPRAYHRGQERSADINFEAPFALLALSQGKKPEKKWMKTEEIHNPQERFATILNKYQNTIADNVGLLQKNFKICLGDNSYKPIGNGIKSWMYHEDHESDFPPLIYPWSSIKFSLPEIYVAAEERGLGIIDCEYTIEHEKFHINAYFTPKNNSLKIKILNFYDSYKYDSLYTPRESILHYWYGGRYPKSTLDTFTTSQLIGHIPFSTVSNSVGPFNGYYPPLEPYDPGYMAFLGLGKAKKGKDDAEKYLPFIQELLQNDLYEKRLAFNQEIMTHLSSQSVSSDIFKAAQQVDVCCKVLNALLTLMYHDLMSTQQQLECPEFGIVTGNEDVHYLNNIQALTHYMQNYASRKTTEHTQGDYLPFYIKYTIEKFSEAIENIVSKHTPGFSLVHRVIKDIDTLVYKYGQRTVTPRTLTLKSSEDSKILALLLQQNKELKESNEMLTQELGEVKKQLNQITDFMQMLIKKADIKI